MPCDVIILGAGAAGLFCAIEAAKRGRHVVVLERSAKAGRKILMSGGGRCNFTNLFVEPSRFICENPHFHKSALKQFTQWDFINWVESHGIAYHEKTLGQLFCDNKASAIVNALLADCERYGVEIYYKQSIDSVTRSKSGFLLSVSGRDIVSKSLVVATGGLSIPSMGSNPFAYQLAAQFGLPVVPVRAGLVPFTLDSTVYSELTELSGLSSFVSMSTSKVSFSEDVLFTHRGLSGPAALQLSSYWKAGEVVIDFMPNSPVLHIIQKKRLASPRDLVSKVFSAYLPKRLTALLIPPPLMEKRVADLSVSAMAKLEECLHAYPVTPSGTEGYRTAEVTLGGVATDALSSKTMASSDDANLFFIGECVDVTGWLGGYNFQWAWSSAWVAGQYC